MVRVVLAGQISIRVKVDARGNRFGGNQVKVPRIHLITAGQQERRGVGVSAVLQLLVVDYSRLITQALECAPNSEIFVVSPRPSHVGSATPK